jgi:hypothetical protein
MGISLFVKVNRREQIIESSVFSGSIILLNT